MSEQNKIDEIKEALAEATPDWYNNGNEIVSKQNLRVGIGGFLKEEDNHLAASAPEYITYLLQKVEFWKQAADNQKDNNMKLISVIHEKDEKAREAINIWETATPEDDFDNIMHAVIDELKDSLAL